MRTKMTYNFKVKKFRKEDNWKDGETGDVYEKEFEVQIESDSLLNAYEEFWNKYCNVPNFRYHELSCYVPHTKQIFCARTENENEKYPDENELKIWKHGNINLYAATFYISVDDQDLSTLGLKRSL